MKEVIKTIVNNENVSSIKEPIYFNLVEKIEDGLRQMKKDVAQSFFKNKDE